MGTRLVGDVMRVISYGLWPYLIEGGIDRGICLSSSGMIELSVADGVI